MKILFAMQGIILILYSAEKNHTKTHIKLQRKTISTNKQAWLFSSFFRSFVTQLYAC
jgi:hypothetical protein